MAWKRVAITAVVLGCLLGACSGHITNCDTCGGELSPPIIAVFSATPSTLPAGGGNVTFSWIVDGATSLSISNGLGTVTPIAITADNIIQDVTVTSTFTLSATNARGTAKASVLISVEQ
jgi:hypothetical protein